MKPFNPLYTFHSLWENFKALTKKMFRKDTGELVVKDKVEFANDVQDFENIVDKDGHKRFIEGDFTMETIEGVTQTYGKWSLSGSHLMFVLCFEAENDSVIPTDRLANITLPEWINAKIFNTYGTTYIDRKSVSMVGATWAVQYLDVSMQKSPTGVNFNTHVNPVTLNSKKGCRIQFDLLIDNAESA